MKESDIQNSIRLALNKYAVIFRNNVGSVRTKDGRIFSSGLPKGYSDLSGFRKSDGKMIFLEIKKKGGKTSKEQKHFLNEMSKYPVIVAVCRSAEEAIEAVVNG